MSARTAKTNNRTPNHRLVKIHYSYRIDEAARLLDVHRNTVRLWLRNGLHSIESSRPILILGRALRAFLEQRRQRNRRPCGPAEAFCFRCRRAVTPVPDSVAYYATSPTLGCMVGICSACSGKLYRRTSRAKFESVWSELAVPLTKPQGHIADRH